MSINTKQMGLRIKTRRKELKLTQNDVAERIGVSNNHISALERGIVVPSLEVLSDICDVLNCSPDYLLLGNMHAYSQATSISEKLQLCSERDLKIIDTIVEKMIST